MLPGEMVTTFKPCSWAELAWVASSWALGNEPLDTGWRMLEVAVEVGWFRLGGGGGALLFGSFIATFRQVWRRRALVISRLETFA